MRIHSPVLALFVLVSSLTLPVYAQLGLSLPSASSVSLGLSGNNTSSAGGVAGCSIAGHAITALHSPGGTVAYYYMMGAESAGISGGGYTDTAAATSTTGMGSTAAFVASNTLNLANLTVRFMPTGAASAAWNLGTDTLGVNYFQSGSSTIEERIYTANPGSVQASLYYAGTRLISFGYSPINMIIDYGASTAGSDDTIQAYTSPVGFDVVSGLSGTSLGLAQALSNDFTAGGGLVQLRFDSFQTATRSDAIGSLGITGVFSFSGSIQAIPETSTYAIWAGALALGGALWTRRRRG